MSLTISLTGDWLSNLGNRRASAGKVTFDSSYATGGLSLTPANIGLGVIERIMFNNVSGYTFSYDYTAQKVQVWAAGGSSGVPNVVVTGSQAAGPALQITPDSNAGVLGKTTAGTVTIPGATFGLVASGSSAAAGEVAASTNLSTLAVEFWAEGK